MLHFRLYAMITAILLLLLTIGCDKATEPKTDYTPVIPDSLNVSPADADWNITIRRTVYETNRTEDFYIKVTYIKDLNYQFDEHDKAVLIVNNQSIKLTKIIDMCKLYRMYFDGHTSLQEGMTYSIGFKYNGQLKLFTDIDIPYASVVTFPEAYSQTEPVNLTWDVAQNSHFQSVGVVSHENVDGGDGIIDTYEVEMDSTLRTATIPGECVMPGDYQTDYMLYVNQASCQIVNRVVLTISQRAAKGYYTQ